MGLGCKEGPTVPAGSQLCLASPGTAWRSVQGDGQQDVQSLGVCVSFLFLSMLVCLHIWGGTVNFCGPGNHVQPWESRGPGGAVLWLHAVVSRCASAELALELGAFSNCACGPHGPQKGDLRG